jgi:hypothetical protein
MESKLLYKMEIKEAKDRMDRKNKYKMIKLAQNHKK